MIGKLDEALRFQETALSLRAQRQQMLASNIANADTPNYKARDVDFSKALQGAMNGAQAPRHSALAKTAVGHLAPKPGAAPAIGGLEPQYRTAAQGSVDGNTVDMDVERNQFTDNALRYEASITMMSHEIKQMLTAIQGQ